MSTRQERSDDEKALDFNPWGDDETDTTTFSDRFVVTRKRSPCAICFAPIGPGRRVRAQVQRNNEDRRVMTFRFCETCCRAMVRRYDATTVAGEMAIELRYEIGRKRCERRELARGEDAAS